MAASMSRRFQAVPSVDGWIIAWHVMTDHGHGARIEQIPHVFVAATEPLEVIGPEVEQLTCIIKPKASEDDARPVGAIRYYHLSMRRVP